MQDGKIFVKSELNEGAEFHFRLPFLKSKKGSAIKDTLSAKAVANTDYTQDGKGIKVLVVEDNTINQMLINKVLQKRSFEIDIAENGVVALNKYKTDHYDIVLMDLQMPEMDGYETTRNIRKMEGDKKDIPIVAMTAHTIKGEMERCLAIGMNDYIPKPFNVSELFDKMFALLKRAS